MRKIRVSPMGLGTLIAMSASGVDAASTYLDTVRAAGNETQRREAFIALAATGFGETTMATNLALGAEHKVQFQSSGIVRRGFVDSFYENLLIEFKQDLETDREGALSQLRERR